jgi:AcrR family transcriptional regulator
MAEVRQKRTEAPEVRRRQILDAAEKRFREAGLHASKMADVAAEAGVSVGMIYQYFPSKEALIEELVRQAAEEQLARISAIFNADTVNFRDAIRAAAKTFRLLVLDQARTTLQLEIAAETARNPQLRRFVSDMYRTVQLRLREDVAKSKPPEWSFEDLEARFDLFSSMLLGAVIRYATEGRAPTPELLALIEETTDRLFTPTAASGASQT